MFVMLLALAVPAAAQQPYIDIAKERYRLFVFGDKFATGLLAGLWRVLKDNPKIVARGRLREGTGLARVRLHDWVRTIATVAENQPMDIAVIMLGANDVRDVSIGGQKLAFGGEAWRQFYAGRVDAVIQALKDRDVAIYWVGLPPMRDAKLDAAVRQIEAVIRERAEAHGVRFIDIRRHFSGPDGRFVEVGADVNGHVVRLRARNGIHFIRAGNTKLASIVWDVIRRDIEEAAQAPASGALAALGALGAPQRPAIGRATPDGEPEYVPASQLPGRDEVYLASSGAAVRAVRSVIDALRRSAVPGSAAEKLFGEGLPVDAPKDRPDNFSLPAALARNP